MKDATELPRRGDWLADARPDPITGLVAFPDFHEAFGDHLVEAGRENHWVGVAIGDVDQLKHYVEQSNATDPESFGHLAGNALMARLGALCQQWFTLATFPAGCVSTFGGDEVIVAATGIEPGVFTPAVAALRDRCRAVLPCSVSFGVTVIDPALLSGADAEHKPHQLGNMVLAGVDRALFRAKAGRGKTHSGGIITELDWAREVADVGAA